MKEETRMLDVLTRNGVLGAVCIGFWRGRKKLRAKEIGMSESDSVAALVSFGQKRLVKTEVLHPLTLIEGRARDYLAVNSFPFMDGLANFIPNIRLAETQQRMDAFKAEFESERDKFMQRYDTLRQESVEEWRKTAPEINKQNPEFLVSAIEEAFPVAAYVQASFKFDFKLFSVGVPTEVQASGLTMVAVGDQLAVMEARKRAAAEASAKIRTDADRFVSECVKSLREQTAMLCSEMLQSTNASESGVHQKTLNRLRTFIGHFKQMNFVNDTQMDRMLAQAEAELLSKSAKDYRDSKDAQTSLINGLQALRSKAQQLAAEDVTGVVSQFAEVGSRNMLL